MSCHLLVWCFAFGCLCVSVSPLVFPYLWSCVSLLSGFLSCTLLVLFSNLVFFNDSLMYVCLCVTLCASSCFTSFSLEVLALLSWSLTGLGLKLASLMSMHWNRDFGLGFFCPVDGGSWLGWGEVDWLR